MPSTLRSGEAAHTIRSQEGSGTSKNPPERKLESPPPSSWRNGAPTSASTPQNLSPSGEKGKPSQARPEGASRRRKRGKEKASSTTASTASRISRRGAVSASSLIMIVAAVWNVLRPVLALPSRLLNHFLPRKYSPPKEYPKRYLRGICWKILGKRLYARFGWEWLAKRSAREHFNDNREKMWDNRWAQLIIVFCNKKGGSAKTAICCWLAALYARFIRIPPVVTDVNESGGTTAARLAIKRSSETMEPDKEGTLEMSYYLESCDENELQTPEALLDVADSHRETGVIVIASDPIAKKVSKRSMRNGIRNAKSMGRVLMVDCGNGLLAVGNMAAVEMGGRLIFCGNSHMADSCVNLKSPGGADDLQYTMDTYTAEGHGEKVRNGIIAIIGRPRDRKRYAEYYGFPFERVFVIPFNRYMKSGKGVALGRVPMRVLAILSDILVAATDMDGIEELENLDSTTQTVQPPAPAGIN